MSGTRGYVGGSPSLNEPDYWWYLARARMLRVVFDDVLAQSSSTTPLALDVGSADGPSGFWANRSADVVCVDVDPRGLKSHSVCARLPDLPFGPATFDIVSAFDVIEHCDPEADALSEISRVTRPGGLLLMSVPAYSWAWTDHDVANGHFRRYTRQQAEQSLDARGFRVLRSTHAFASVFPAFAASRLASRARQRLSSRKLTAPADIVEVPPLPRGLSMLLLALCRIDEWALAHYDLGFGSSILVAAEKPAASGALADRPIRES